MATKLSESTDRDKKSELCKQWLSKGGEYHSLAHFSVCFFYCSLLIV
jgi:hypothetical protein